MQCTTRKTYADYENYIKISSIRIKSIKSDEDSEAKMEKKPEQEKVVQQQKAHETEKSGQEENKNNKEVNLEGLPMEDSPYLNYKNLEDYKLQGYGAQGHQEPTLGRSAGGTDAPTPSGATAVSSKPAAPAAADVNKRRGGT